MMFFVIGLIIFGMITFFITAGSVIFIKNFSRKEEPKKPEVPEAFFSNEVEMKGIDKSLTKHVHDPIIMIPLLEAKKRWLKNDEIKTLTIIGKRGTILKADYWENEKISDKISHNKNEVITAILIHGMQDSSAGMAYLAEEYHKIGISVLSINLRGHGESQGKIAGLGYLDSYDLMYWILELERRSENIARKYILHGVSMGGATVINLITTKLFYRKKLNEKVLLAISDCGFGSFSDQISKQMNTVLKGKGLIRVNRILIKKAMSLCSFVCGRGFFGRNSPVKRLLKLSDIENSFVEKRNLEKKTTELNSPEKRLAELNSSVSKKRLELMNSKNIGLIFFHGENDLLVSCETSKKMYNIAKNSVKELLIVPNAPHIGSYFYDKQKYMEIIEESLILSQMINKESV